jgi:predicted TIM-barrel fold metal-dependent hydrolase
MLHVAETHVARAAFPVVDFHSHVSPRPASKEPAVPPARMVPSMDAINIRTMVNLTGGSGGDLAATIAAFDRAFPGRFVTMTEPTWTRAGETGYAAWQGDEIAKAKAAGAVGLKILKTLGLYLRDGGPAGKLVRVDDERFDPMWEACGRLGLPVAMHVGDPEAFFSPIDRFNERYEEARRASGLVVLRQGLSGLRRHSCGARPRVRQASEDDVRGAARRSLV